MREVYAYQIREWFKQTILKDADGLKIFWQAFEKGDAATIEKSLNYTLNRTISVYDIKKPESESFYHAFLAGMLTVNPAWGVVSNREGGDGRADLMIKTEDPDAGIVIEIKKADSMTELDVKSQIALEQIRENQYDAYLRNEGREKIWAYGIAFWKKRCRVVVERL